MSKKVLSGAYGPNRVWYNLNTDNPNNLK